MKIAKKISLFLGVIVFVLLLPFLLNLFISPVSPIEAWRKVLGDPEYLKINTHRPLESQTSTVVLGQRKLKVPLMYIDGQLDKGEVQDGINLKYVLPDFSSILEFRTKVEFDQAFKAGRFAHMLLLPVGFRPSPPQVVENIKKYNRMDHYGGKEFGLEKYIDTGSLDAKKHRGHDTYLELKDGIVQSFITCTPEKLVPAPQCSHHFEDKGILYEISYNRANYLLTWQEQRQKAIEFVDSFEIPFEDNGE